MILDDKFTLSKYIRFANRFRLYIPPQNHNRILDNLIRIIYLAMCSSSLQPMVIFYFFFLIKDQFQLTFVKHYFSDKRFRYNTQF